MFPALRSVLPGRGDGFPSAVAAERIDTVELDASRRGTRLRDRIGGRKIELPGGQDLRRRSGSERIPSRRTASTDSPEPCTMREARMLRETTLRRPCANGTLDRTGSPALETERARRSA